jgi:hypothetical protein
VVGLSRWCCQQGLGALGTGRYEWQWTTGRTDAPGKSTKGPSGVKATGRARAYYRYCRRSGRNVLNTGGGHLEVRRWAHTTVHQDQAAGMIVCHQGVIKALLPSHDSVPLQSALCSFHLGPTVRSTKPVSELTHSHRHIHRRGRSACDSARDGQRRGREQDKGPARSLAEVGPPAECGVTYRANSQACFGEGHCEPVSWSSLDAKRHQLISRRLSLPASLLEPIPNLEYWQYADRADIFAA